MKGCPAVKNLLRSQVILLALRIAVGALFVLASIDKLHHPEDFYEIIMGYRIVPWSIALIMAIWLPWLELCVGTILILGIWPRAAALLLAALTFMFIVAIVSALARGIDLTCGCFLVSPEAEIRTWTTLWQEGVFLLGCVWLWIGHLPTDNDTQPQTEAM